MFHAVYMKTRPKGKCFFVFMSLSQETATNDMQALLDQAKITDNNDVQVCIQSFETCFYIPEFLSEVKKQKLLYN